MKTRVLSAIIAVVLLIGITLIWKLKGLYAICTLATFGLTFEYSRLILGFPFVQSSREDLVLQPYLRWFFVLFSLLVFAATAFADLDFILMAISLSAVIFLTMALMTVRTVNDLAGAIHIQGLGLMGFIYCGIFPGLATRLLQLNENGLWFFALLAIVFSGDTFAYLTGRAFGRQNLLKPVSPKKTIEGAFGGLLGSAVAGAVIGLLFLDHVPLPVMVLLAVVTGAFAQAGDLYESLLKRVAEVKDSGSIMPGHGGFLDRLDGVLFAAPVFYVLTRFLVS